MMCKPECVEDFNYHTDRFVQDRGVWSDKCSCTLPPALDWHRYLANLMRSKAWYKNGTTDGRVVAVYPGTNVAFIEMLRDPRWEDYTYEYYNKATRYSAFGHGFTVGEVEGRGRSNHFLDRLHTLDDIKVKHGIPIDGANMSSVSAHSPLPK